MTKILLGWGALLACQGCTSYTKVLSARVESVTEPNVLLRIDVDRDLGGPDWKEHRFRFDYVVLDEERLKGLRQRRPELPQGLEEAGRVLVEDDRELFAVDGRWGGNFIPAEGGIETSPRGGIEPGAKVAEGRWSYRLAIPFRQIRGDWPIDPDRSDYSRSDAYELSPGREVRLWGRFFGVKYLGYPQLKSDVCTLGFTVPPK